MFRKSKKKTAAPKIETDIVDWSSNTDHNALPSSATAVVTDAFKDSNLKDPDVVDQILEKMCEDSNIKGQSKANILSKPFPMKVAMAQNYQKTRNQQNHTVGVASDDSNNIVEELKHSVASGKGNQKQILEKISRAAALLRSKELSWVREFADNGGLNSLCSVLEFVFTSEEPDFVVPALRDCVACMKAFMNNRHGIDEVINCQNNRALRLLAQTLSYQSMQVVPSVLDLMSAMCMYSDESYTLVLNSMTYLSKRLNEPARFFVFARMMKDTSEMLMEQLDSDDSYASKYISSAIVLLTTCVTFINKVLITDEFELRMHLRFEFINLGIEDLFKNLQKVGDNEAFIGKDQKGNILLGEIAAYQQSASDDVDELAFRFDFNDIDLSNRDELFEVLKKSSVESNGEQYFLSIMQYLMLVRDDHAVRPKYYRLIADVVAQIVLQRDGVNPDPTGFKMNVNEVIDSFSDKERLVDMKADVKKMTKALENIIKIKVDTKKELQSTIDELQTKKAEIESELVVEKKKLEELEGNKDKQLKEDADKIKTLVEEVEKTSKEVAELKEKLSKSGLTVDWGTVAVAAPVQVTGGPAPPPPPAAPNTGVSGGGPPPPPPPPGGIMVGNAVVGGGPPPPPPPPGMGAPPPPPPPPGMGAPPPPPPPPGFGGPPPPPPPPGMGPPGAPPPPPGPPGAPPPPGGGPPPPPGFGGPPMIGGVPAKKKYTPSQAMKRVNWGAIPPIKTKDTLWAKVDETKWESIVSFTDLEEQFSMKKAKPKTADAGDAALAKKPKKEDIILIDGKKAYNLAIFLGRLKMTNDECKDKFLLMDDTVFDEQILSTFDKFKAEPEEKTALKEFTGPFEDLGPSDKFLHTMTFKIPRYEQRLTCMIFRVRYDEIYEEFERDVNFILKASQQVKESKKLSQLLEVVLLLGNYMNSSIKSAGPVHGFKLNFLNKLSSTKTVDNKSNLLNFLADLIESKFPELEDWFDELDCVEGAARVDIQQLDATRRELEKGLNTVAKELPNHENPEAGDNFPKVLTEFQKESQAKFDITTKKFTEGEEQFKELLKFFAEDPKKMSTDEFFSIFKEFIDNFKKAKEDNKALKEKKAREEKRVKEQEERRKRQEAKRLAKEEAAKKAASGDGEGVMDNLLNNLRSGAAFQQEATKKPTRQRRERVEKKEEA